MPKLAADGLTLCEPPGPARGPGRSNWVLMAPFVALAMIGPAARAEPEPGSRIDTARGSVSSIENAEERETVIRVMNTFGRCVARNRPRVAEEILALPLRTPEQDRVTHRLVGGEDSCFRVTGTLRFQPPLLVGAMAEWFITARYDEVDLGAVARLTDESQAGMGLAPRSGYEEVAICVVRRDPHGVKAIFETRPASGEENAALARIVPHLGPCLPAGTQFEFGRPSLRALLAAGLYRVLSAFRASASASLSERD